MLTIGIYCHSLSGGGIERVSATLARLWLERGYQVVFLVQRSLTAADHFQVPPGVVSVLLPMDDHDRHAVWHRTIAAERIGFVIYQFQNDCSIERDARSIREAGAKLIVCIHETGFGDRFYSNRVPLAGGRSLRYEADRIVCLSPVEALYWQRVFRKPVSCIYNPMSLAVAASVRQPEGCDVIWVGRFSNEKRLQDAIAAYALVARRFSGGRLIILGGRECEIAGYRRQAARLGLSRRIVFAGMVKNVRAYLECSRVYLLTSHNESFSLSLAEAKACGLPTVMYELNYLPLARRDQGILAVPKGDVAGLAAAVLRLLNDDALCRRLGEEAIKSLEEFTNERVLGAWDRLFAQLAGAGAATGSSPDAVESTENYRLLVDELIESWEYYTFENTWKLKFMDWLSTRIPAAWLRRLVIRGSGDLRVFYRRPFGSKPGCAPSPS